MAGNYRVAPIFPIRMAGVPFDALEQLATTKSATAARDLLVRQAEFARAKLEVEHLLQRRDHGLLEELFRAWRKAIRPGTMPPSADPPSRAFAVCWECAFNLATAESRLKQSPEDEVAAARTARMAAEVSSSAR